MDNVIVVGSGAAGLAASYWLTDRRIAHTVLDRSNCIGNTWRELYDSLTLHTGKHLSHLPGWRFPAYSPLFPPKDIFRSYLEDYAERWKLPVKLGTEVINARRESTGWAVTTSAGQLHCRHLVVATGIVSNPYIPDIPGLGTYSGQLIHSVSYKNPGSVRGNTLIVGIGNSAGEIASELAYHGTAVTLAVRGGAYVVPLTIAGIPVQYYSYGLLALPAWLRNPTARAFTGAAQLLRGPSPIPKPSYPMLSRPPVIGLKINELIREHRIRLTGNIARFHNDSVEFVDRTQEKFATVILATGFRAATRTLDPLLTYNPSGFPHRHGVVSTDAPDLYFVGHRYGPLGGITYIREDAHTAANEIAKRLN